MNFQALLICGWKQPFAWLPVEDVQYTLPAICIKYGDEN